MTYTQCPPETGTWTEDQKFRCCIEDKNNVGYKYLILTNSREECVTSFGDPGTYFQGYYENKCYGLPLSCDHLALVAGGLTIGIITIVALFWRGKKKLW